MTQFIKKIYSMSYELKDIRKKLLSGKSDRFIEHCAKILEQPNSINVNHWCDELYFFCDFIIGATVKPDDKHVGRDLIWNTFFAPGNNFSSFQQKLKRRRKQLGKKEDDSKDKEKFDKAYRFFSAVCDKLADDSLDEDNIHDLMNTILLGYNE